MLVVFVQLVQQQEGAGLLVAENKQAGLEKIMLLENYLLYVGYMIIYLILAIGMRFILNFRSAQAYSADDVMKAGNMAVGLRRSGAQLGLAISMIGVMSGSSHADLIKDVVDTLLYGIIAVFFMVFSLIITDKSVLHSVDNTHELKNGNIAVGLVEFGTLVMTGILAYASITGEAGGIVSSVAYFFAGQIMLVSLIAIYEKIVAKRLNLIQKITEGNLSAGMYLGSKIICYGLIIQSAIVGNSDASNYTQAVISFLTISFAGMIILYLFEFLFDRVIMVTSTVKEVLENDLSVIALQLSLAKIGMALILGMAIL
ncbi:MAG: uncharacterized membrane protein YjfL (UPF0719 family) [Oleiphilaceae bacterium]